MKNNNDNLSSKISKLSKEELEVLKRNAQKFGCTIDMLIDGYLDRTEYGEDADRIDYIPDYDALEQY